VNKVMLAVAAASADDPGPATPPGKALYERRCAGCQDRASDRTPSRETLSRNSPGFLFSALREVMAPMAAGLSQDEMKAIALYLGAAAPEPGDPNPHAIWRPSSDRELNVR
jgi:polyvinyl alcohol dehydrogenase (cytochrome)